MFLSQKDIEFIHEKASFFSTSKLHDLDDYWSKNSSHPLHKQIHAMVESILIQRGEKTLKREQLNIINTLEKSFLISTPMGRLSANIIGFITKILLYKNLIKIK